MLGSVQTQATAINNLGDIAGFFVDAKGNKVGFVEWQGAFNQYNDPKTPNMTRSVWLLGINDHGTAVGFYMDAVGQLSRRHAEPRVLCLHSAHGPWGLARGLA